MQQTQAPQSPAACPSKLETFCLNPVRHIEYRLPFMATDEPSTIHIGNHTLHTEDTLLHVRWMGHHTLAEQHQIYDRIAEYLEARGSALLLFDVRQAVALRPEHREASANWWRTKPLASIALAHYGLNQAGRFTTTMIARAVRALSKSEVLVENFDAEADARLWLEAMAKEIRPFR